MTHSNALTLKVRFLSKLRNGILRNGILRNFPYFDLYSLLFLRRFGLTSVFPIEVVFPH